MRHARKLTSVAAAFFPRYLFIRLDLNQHRWRSVNGTFGVARLVMQGELPQPVPRGVVETMIAFDVNGSLCLEESPNIAGKVRPLAGAFAEQLGILDRLHDSGRVRLLLRHHGWNLPGSARRERDYCLNTVLKYAAVIRAFGSARS